MLNSARCGTLRVIRGKVESEAEERDPIMLLYGRAGMAELADAHGLGPCAERRAGSSPVPAPKKTAKA